MSQTTQPEYDDLTVEELRDELRDRDLKVSGSKDELVARLTEDEDAPEDDEQPTTSDDRPSGSSARAPGLRQVMARIREEFEAVTGMPIERAAGLMKVEDEWRAHIDVVEVERVPRSTDVIATYEVTAAADGELLSFDRVARFRRSEAAQ